MAPAVLDWRRPYVGERQGAAGEQAAAGATAVLVLGIASLVACPVVGIAAVVLGSRVLRELDANPGRYSGRYRVSLGQILGGIGFFAMGIFYALALYGLSLS
jgi:hypothetical protein